MNCKYHSTHEAKALCEKCKQPICPECTINIDEKTICRQCIQLHLISSPTLVPRKTFPEKLLFFCFSLIPGAAHMHMGLFRRGLQFMLLTFGGMFFISFLGLDFMIPLILLPTWFFSFFESYYLRRQLEQGQTLKDQDLFDCQIFDYTPLLKNRRLIGAIITVIGLLSLIQTLDESGYVTRFFKDWDYYYHMVRISIVPICLILAGVYLIVKASKKAYENKGNG